MLTIPADRAIDCGLRVADCGFEDASSRSLAMDLSSLLAFSLSFVIIGSIHHYSISLNHLPLKTPKIRNPQSAIRNPTGSPRSAETLSTSEYEGGSPPGRIRLSICYRSRPRQPRRRGARAGNA